MLSCTMCRCFWWEQSRDCALLRLSIVCRFSSYFIFRVFREHSIRLKDKCQTARRTGETQQIIHWKTWYKWKNVFHSTQCLCPYKSVQIEPKEKKRNSNFITTCDKIIFVVYSEMLLLPLLLFMLIWCFFVFLLRPIEQKQKQKHTHTSTLLLRENERTPVDLDGGKRRTADSIRCLGNKYDVKAPFMAFSIRNILFAFPSCAKWNVTDAYRFFLLLWMWYIHWNVSGSVFKYFSMFSTFFAFFTFYRMCWCVCVCLCAQQPFPE